MLLIQVMEIVCTFGPLKAYHFEVNVDLEEPCAFMEVIKHFVLQCYVCLRGRLLMNKIFHFVLFNWMALFVLDGKPL